MVFDYVGFADTSGTGWATDLYVGFSSEAEMELEYQLGISSDTVVVIEPDWNYRQGKKQFRTETRAKDGTLYSYKWGDYEKFSLSVQWASSSDAALVNSWWDDRTELLFFIVSGTATEVHSVMIMNNATPLAQHKKPYPDKYRGKIILESY